MKANGAQGIIRVLSEYGPAQVRDIDDVARALLDQLRPILAFSGFFLLDSESGIHQARVTVGWPRELEVPCPCMGDELLAGLSAGLLRTHDLRACHCPAPIDLVAPLVDERAEIRGVLMGGSPADGQAATSFAAVASLLSSCLRILELPREKEAIRRYYDDVLAHLDEAVVLTDVDGLILHWNQGAEILLGYSAEEVVSRGGNFLIPEANLEQTRHVRQRVAAGEVIPSRVCARLNRAGKIRELLSTMVPVRDRDGEVIGIAEIMRSPASSRPRRQRREAEVRQPDSVAMEPGIQGMVGAHPSIRKLRQLVHRVAPMDSAVLILGESGTGKELVANAIHGESRRRSGPFVAVNCAAIPPALLESEMFGYEKGAFTGAARRHRGLLEQADQGTVLLDEIAEIPLDIQVKLLRALQEKTIRRLGASQEIRLDLRVVAATNRPIREQVDAGHFREDLYYRLNVVTLSVPPLRERLSDIPLLVRHGLRCIAARNSHDLKRISSEAVQELMDHQWPGNVRELFSVLERTCVLSRQQIITAADIRESIGACRPVLRQLYDTDVRLSLEEVEQRHMRIVLNEVDGNVRAAAAILGISRDTVYRKMEKYDLRS